jgi:integrase
MARIRLPFVNGFRNRNRRDGRTRYYFRRRGQRAVPLPGLPGSEEFMAAYAAALDVQERPAAIGASRTQPGTINALVVTYYASAAWAALSPETQKLRRPFIERVRAADGAKRVALLERHHVEKMLARIASPAARRQMLYALRGLMRAAIPTMRRDDPTAGLIVKVKTRGHHTWTGEEVEQYRARWPLGSQQRLVMEFALQTTSRRGEIVRLGPQHVKNGWIRIERTHGSADVTIPVTPELQAAIDAMPKGHLTFIVTAYGKPRSKRGLGVDFAKWTAAAGLPKRCRMHGLKKSGMTQLADAGGTAHELMAVSGHKTLSMVQLYTRDADRSRLAGSAMAKLRGQNEDTAVTNTPAAVHKQPQKGR